MKLKKKSEPHQESHERWLVSYADFITLLFALFVVLYATSSQNQEKEKQFEQSIKEKLKLLKYELKIGDQSKLSNILKNLVDQDMSSIDLFQKKQIGNQELKDYVQRLINKKISSSSQKKLISGIQHDRLGVRISLLSSAFFDSGSWQIMPSALSSLDKIAETLYTSPYPLIVEGHTDNQPILSKSSTVQSNWELASLRATSVLRYLIERHHFTPNKLSAISYGEQKPVVSNESEEGRSLNRRIELLIVHSPIDED